MAALVKDMERGAFTYVPPTLPIIRRAMAIDAQFPELALGLVDSSIVALAEMLHVGRVATRDLHDFGAVTLQDGKTLELVVYPPFSRGAMNGLIAERRLEVCGWPPCSGTPGSRSTVQRAGR